MAGRTAIFIDGAYFENVTREDFNSPRIDFAKFSDAIAGSADILRTYYYHCLPWHDNLPTAEQSNRYSSKRKFFKTLERHPRYNVRLGQLAYRGTDASGNPIFQQKRVDILLGVDLVLLAAKGRIQEAVLVAGDSDFIPAVSAAQNEGVLVRLFHGGAPHTDLWEMADEQVRIDQGLIDSVLL